MSLTAEYKTALQQPDMVHDAAQERAIEQLEKLSIKLAGNSDGLLHSLRRLSPFDSHQPAPIKGIYLWGGVGRGKTWLMNLFFEQLPIEQKYRIHFHHFMLDIHAKLAELNKQKNPLQFIAKQLSKRYRVLCIDEFIVTNITDAMILSELLHALLRNGVCIVATSNRVPDDLYLNGLQRERFLPAIDLIKTHTEVFHLDGGIDHRTSLLEQANVFYTPITEETDQQIEQRMRELSITPVTKNKTLDILNRNVETISCSEEIVWFDFDVICTSPRAAQDYIAIAQRYSTVIVTNIPVMDEYSDDKARRFIYLIDELYDRNVILIASAHAEAECLYTGDMLEFAFHRTSSRLVEMSSHQYLSQSHKPFSDNDVDNTE